MSINITKCTSTTNTTAKSGRSIKYIVLHYTAGTTSKSGTAKSVAQYFANSSVQASADFIVDDENIVQFNPDIANRYCWSVGGSKYSSPSTSLGATLYNTATNANTVNIEMCSSKTNTSSLLASDTDWYFTDSVIENAVELTKYLMDLYDIDSDHVIMHHHVTGKVCPNPWCVSESRLSQWYAFKAKLTDSTTETEDDEVVTTGTMTVNGKDIKIDKIVKDGTTYIKLRGLEAAGFDVGYDADTKNITLDNTIKDIDVKVDGEATTLKAVNLNGSNYCQLRDVAKKTGNMEIDYKDLIVIINTQG